MYKAKVNFKYFKENLGALMDGQSPMAAENDAFLPTMIFTTTIYHIT